MIYAFSLPLVSISLNNFFEEAAFVVHFRINFHGMCDELEFDRLVVNKHVQFYLILAWTTAEDLEDAKNLWTNALVAKSLSTIL